MKWHERPLDFAALATATALAVSSLAGCVPSARGATGGEGSTLSIAVVDAAVSEADAFECFTVQGFASQSAPTGEMHGSDMLSTVLNVAHDQCPDWRQQVEVRLYTLADDHPTHQEVASQVRKAVADGAHLLVLSVAFDRDFRDVRSAVDFAADEGVAIVAAAGNREGLPAGYPAMHERVVSVGSISSSGIPSVYSARGGVDVFVNAERTAVLRPDGSRAEVSGTSFAAALFAHKVIRAVLAGATLSDAVDSAIASAEKKEAE